MSGSCRNLTLVVGVDGFRALFQSHLYVTPQGAVAADGHRDIDRVLLIAQVKILVNDPIMSAHDVGGLRIQIRVHGRFLIASGEEQCGSQADRCKNRGTGFFCGRALTIANLKTCVRRYILSPKDSTFASMNQNNDIDMYKGLAVYFLPEGVLNYFDVVAFAEEPPKKNDVLYSSELHIYLDEKDNRTSDMQGSKSKGYTEDKQILDFPVRGRKAVIHIRRKRWLMPDGSCQVVDLHKKVEIEYKGTRYSKEFALFLKMATGQ